MRGVVPRPLPFGSERAYWRVWQDDGQAVGVLLTAEIIAVGFSDAESKALSTSRRLGLLLSLWSGSPVSTPRLIRMARVGATGLSAQRSYVYQGEVARFPSVPLDRHEFERMLLRYAELDAKRAEAIDRGLRWYSIAVGSSGDAATQYLACWVGLESVGAELNARYHPIPRARCETCDSPAGEKRPGVEAGLHHLLRRAIPEVVADREDYFRLAQIRHDIAHGLTEADAYEAAAEPRSPDLVLALGSALLTLFAPPSASPRAWRSYLPREYAPHPDAMAELEAEGDLPEHDPWTGGWVDLMVDLRRERTSAQDTGEPITRLLPLVRYGYQKPPEQAEAKTGFVVYQRHGNISEDIDVPEVKESPHYRGPAPEEPWHPRPLTDAWARLLRERDMGDNPGEGASR